MGVIAGDIFPFLVSAAPPVHRWMHSACADTYRCRQMTTAEEVKVT